MNSEWESRLEAWQAAGLLDEDTVTRIRAFETDQAKAPGFHFRWPTLLALAFGVLLLGSGVLLFISAHWDRLSPAERMALVVVLVALFHVGGAFYSHRFYPLSVALHALGTVSLGAGIALAGQIYNAEAHWPAEVLLWALGAAIGWWFLRQWPQYAMFAILAPVWLGSEWLYKHLYARPAVAGWLALGLIYLCSPYKPLIWIGGLSVIPLAFAAGVDQSSIGDISSGPLLAAYAAATILPLVAGYVFRRDESLWDAPFVVWAVLLSVIRGPSLYIWCALGSMALVGSGIRETRAERINLGIVGFALTVLSFYFAKVMGKLERSGSLVLLGILFLAGGWALERTRRHLIRIARGDE